MTNKDYFYIDYSMQKFECDKIEQIMHSIQECICKKKIEKNIVLDFSNNNICDWVFMRITTLFLEKLEPNIKDPCVINFTKTRIHGAVISVKQLLKCKKVLYLVMCDTGVSSTNCAEFYKTLTDEEIEKLVWIGPLMVKSTYWNWMVNKNKIDKIRKVHLNYFENYQ